MNLKFLGVGRGLTTLIMATGLALVSACSTPESPQTASALTSEETATDLFVKSDFEVPVLVEADGFKLVPLGPDVVEVDFEAYMSSIDHLQETFTRSTNWPREDLSSDDAMQDMLNEKARFNNRESFAYAVLTPDGSRERGSVYVSPSPVKGHDAVVRFWVTKAEYDQGFDAELNEWVANWIQTEWPFTQVAYPGRAIEWADWDALLAAAKP
ncbi:MAG: twin-arginine translocation pathway signal protein [Pseudomonadota bacterium]